MAQAGSSQAVSSGELRLPRIVVCGAVDDGKSTLIGRLLAETGSIPSDEARAAELPDGTVDFSRLTDGLESEREQGITIDVAYRYVRLPGGRRALLADSPGHEQYTRNMAVAASLADVALLVVDAVRGIRRQTLRHAAVCRLMGVRSYVVAINKIDAVENAEERFAELRAELEQRLSDMPNVTFVPVSGLRGDNVTGDDSLLSALVDGIADGGSGSHEFDDLRISVQTVLRDSERRWYAGRIASGSVNLGDTVSIWPSGATAIVLELVTAGAVSLHPALTGTSVAIELDRETDIGRGDVLVTPNTDLPVSRAHLADLVWLDDESLNSASSYVLRVGSHEVPARVDQVRFVLDLDAGEEVPTQSIRANDIGRVEITTDRPLLLDPYGNSRHTGGFILCDRLTGRTLAAGMAVHPLQRESDVVRHAFSVSREARESLNGVRAGVLWLTGLPGSGKSTIADEVEKSLFERGIRAYVLDGDTVRQTLSEDLGFSPEDRRENVRRVARTAQLMMDAGLIVIVSLVSPFRDDRDAARELFAHADFAEVFVDTPLEVCQERDPKGLYARAAQATNSQMTGAGQSYEAPLHPEVQLDGTQSIVENAQTLVSWIMGRRAR
jgi:bifunctional enzyme CysN/CysC